MKKYQGAWTRAEASHVMRRMVIGCRASEISRAVSEGMEQTVERLLEPRQEWPASLAKYMDNDVVTAVNPLDHPEWIVYNEEKNLRYIEAVQWFCRQLIEDDASAVGRMVLFWHTVMPVSLHGSHYAEHVLDYFEVLRKHAVGSVVELTDGVLHSTAMQIFLDGVYSRWFDYRDEVNENHARELLELHTLGVYGSDGERLYSQQDIHQLARAMTGWRLEEEWQDGPNGCQYLIRKRKVRFDKDWWYRLPTTIFGEESVRTTRDFMPLLLRHRALDFAKNICRRWYEEFVCMDVNEDFVAEMAALLVEEDFAFDVVLRHVLTSEHFYAREHRMRVVSSPLHMVLSRLRQVQVQYVPDFHDDDGRLEDDLVLRLHSFKHCPLYPPHVKGWESAKDTLTGAGLIRRTSFARQLAEGTLVFKDYLGGRPVLTYDPDKVLQEQAGGDIVALRHDLLCDVLGVAGSRADVDRAYREVRLEGRNSSEFGPVRSVLRSVYGSVRAQLL
jgi:uncharacterized protein (DUF1800 family)